MAFNNFNSSRQMFPTQNQGNFGGMQASGQQMGGFQPNQPYGVQGFAPQQSQGFPSFQMGTQGTQLGQPMGPHMNPQMQYQMGPQMRPKMGPHANPQMELQIGAFPSNVQLGHQFPKQHQKVIDQQRKLAEEQLKKQEELKKKKQYEAEKRRLQQTFSAKKPSNADALNSLFGKNKKGGGSSMTDLIGSLGSETSTKPATSKPSSVFSRPSSSATHPSHPTPGLWGSGYMTAGQMTPQGSLGNTPSSKQIHDLDDFGDFSQGPTVPTRGDFSDFQEAHPTTQFGGGSFPVLSSSPAVHPNVSGSTSVFSQPQGWHSTPSVPVATSSTGTQHSFPMTQSSLSATSSIQGMQTRQDHTPKSGFQPPSVTQVGPMSHFSGDSSTPQTGSTPVIPTQSGQTTQFSGDASRPQTGSMPGMSTQGGQMAHFMGETSKNRASSIPEMMSNVGGNTSIRGAMPQSVAHHTHLTRNQEGGNVPMGVLPPTICPQEGGFGSGPSHPGTVPAPSDKDFGIQQGFDRSSMPTVPVEPVQEPVPEVEDSPERKLELLYGVTLPDWCVNGTDLPGVYKEITEKTSDVSDAIDTNRLFPILMASDLPRDQLGHIWNQANKAVPGQLNTLELRIVLGLVALAQAGLKTERLTLEKLASCKAAPIPTIPEHVLQTKGRGWSFTEPSQEGTQSSGMIEGSTSRGRHSSTSSDHSVDPNDKYSVFRTVDQPEAAGMASFPSVDSNDRFGAFQSGDQPVLTPAPQPSQLPLFQGGATQLRSGWHRTEASGMDEHKLSNQQQTLGHFGHFQSAAGQGTNEQNEFGDFRGPASFLNNISSGASNLGDNLSQDDFSDFQSEESTASVSSQKTSQANPDFRNFQAGTDWTGGTSSDSKPIEIAAAKPQEDDFGNFQGGKESETADLTSIKAPKQQDQLHSTQGFQNFQISGKLDIKATSSAVAGVDFFSKAVNNSTTKSVGNVSANSLTEADDFGDFQHSPGPFSTSSKGFTSFSSGGSEKLVSSLENFKLSNSAPSSAQGGVNPPSLKGYEGLGKSSTTEKHATDTNNQNTIANFSTLGNDGSPPSNQPETSGDRYSAFKDADFGSGGGLFDVQKPVTAGDQVTDDGFADFGGFEVADQFKSNGDSDFGAFKSTENVQSVSFGVVSGSQPAQQNFNGDFGNFNSSGSRNLSAPHPEKDSSSEFGGFGSFVAGSSAASNSQPHLTSSDSLINAVSLEPTERYKVLSHDSGDRDQHAHAWSRCLNSCLLTLATATLAVQKIGEQSVKAEVLESKEGATYFSAIVEIYRVTLRIKASINKSAPNNTKLKDIQQEIERTWKDLSSFLSGSQIFPSRSSLDFTLHHVSASEDGSAACGICLLNVNKSTQGSSKHGDGKLMYGGRQYHSTCANFWCNRVDSVLPSLLPIDSLI